MDNFEEIQALISQLNIWTKAYDEGKPLVSDRVWDEKYFELQHLENLSGIYFANSPTQKVDYQVVNQLNKVKHNHSMLSLDKTKDWDEFVSYFGNKDAICTVKLDGLTCSLRYIDGYLVSAETRGNGEVGEDILHNAKVIKNIPKRIDYKDELIIDGEVICTYNNFKPFAEEYKNPRNFAAGSIRLLDAEECARRNLSFVAWNVVKGFHNISFIANLFDAQKLGFSVVPTTSSFDYDAKEYLQDCAKEYGYPIDGLVGWFNDIKYGKSLGSTGHHSKAAYAFKFYDEEYETELLDIEWSMSKTGQLCPIAIFKKINIDGTEVSRASLSNISVMKNTLGERPFVGQIIIVTKRNQIIPKIEKAKGEDGNWI